MYLAQLKLRNFRGFAALDLDLEPRVLVLVGRNGAGKSTLLEAIAAVHSYLAAEFFKHEDYQLKLTPSDVRTGEVNAALAASWRDPEYAFEMVCTREPWEVRTSVREGTLTRPPLCIFYTVDRSRWKRDPFSRPGSSAELTIATQNPAWDDWRNPGPLPLQRFVDWFKAREDLENQERVTKDMKWADTALEGVRRAVRAVLGPEYGAPRIERSGGIRLVVAKSGQVVSLEQLSDGERSLLLIAGNLARLMHLLDPRAADPLNTPATVLIDELELHLHPAWQRTILRALLHAFPAMQLIVATHSAAVVSEAPSGSVRLLDDFQVYAASTPVAGRDINALFREIFGVSERPTAIDDKLHDIARLIERNDLEAAKARLSELVCALGDSDQEVVRLRTMLEFLERPLDADEA